jgi:hypothetical protein
MHPRELEEYRALRGTIRTRGTARVCLFVIGFGTWAVLSLTALALALPPVATLASLAVLAATFEAVFALHVGVERVGRYLQVFHEDRWEQTALDFGAPLAGTGSDPLFTYLFAIATLLNAIPIAGADPVRLELVVIGAAHGLFLARVIVARRAATRQRAVDLDRFRALKRC